MSQNHPQAEPHFGRLAGEAARLMDAPRQLKVAPHFALHMAAGSAARLMGAPNRLEAAMDIALDTGGVGAARLMGVSKRLEGVSGIASDTGEASAVRRMGAAIQPMAPSHFARSIDEALYLEVCPLRQLIATPIQLASHPLCSMASVSNDHNFVFARGELSCLAKGGGQLYKKCECENKQISGLRCQCPPLSNKKKIHFKIS